MSYPPQLAQQFEDIGFQLGETRYPFTGTVVSHDGTEVTFTIPSFDGDQNKFGPIPYSHSTLSAGSTILLVNDENGTPWVISP